ncbi:MAG: formyltransferase [Synergistota bacterium]|nr:formyltransferase [Synergistota bacterium]
MSKPAIVAFAYNEVGYRCLETLFDMEANVVAVVTYTDDPDEEIWFRSVAELARSRGIEPLLDLDLKDQQNVKTIKKLKPKLIFSFYYRDIIPEKILKVAKLGAYNMHGSLLPRYRGRACINWAILNGEKETGATLHRMTSKVDRGEVIDQEVVRIEETDGAKEVFMKICDAAAKIVARTFPELESGRVVGAAQDETMATEFGGRRPEDGIIRWSNDSRRIYNLIRAVTHPYPGAYTDYRGRKLFIWWGKPQEGASLGKPGEVLSLDPLTVATGRGNLRVLRAQLDGESEMDGPDFARKKLNVGALLGQD